jgi:hypothetical protein
MKKAYSPHPAFRNQSRTAQDPSFFQADIGDEDFHVDLELLHRLLVKELAGRITKGEY